MFKKNEHYCPSKIGPAAFYAAGPEMIRNFPEGLEESTSSQLDQPRLTAAEP